MDILTKFEKNLNQLVEMGFSVEDAKTALENAGGDLNSAVAALLG